MGDRICLTFTDGKSFSPTLYAHWDGIILIERARDFYEEFNGKIRAEPENWMVNFISYLRKGKVCDGYYYLYQLALSEGNEIEKKKIRQEAEKIKERVSKYLVSSCVME